VGKSPFIDAIEALEEIRDFCEQREKSYEGWDSTTVSLRLDLKRVHAKAEKAIKVLVPGQPSSNPIKDELDAFGRDLAEP